MELVEDILGSPPAAWAAVQGGYTPAARYLVQAGTSRFFVKAATTPLTATMLRREIKAYGAVTGAFVPEVIGSRDDADGPVLVLEDLSTAAWAPSWSEARIASALGSIDDLHSAVADLPAYEQVHGWRAPGWEAVATEPGPFLSLGMVTERWLRHALPVLVQLEAACPTAGAAPAHWDLRSDNMCFTGPVTKLVDWSEACLSNPELDLGCWLPSLAFEGGPPPETFLPHSPEIAAWVSGFFAARAGLANIPDAPFVRRVQREQLSTALPWVQRAAGLPAL
jgi:hypothetical protein